MYSNKTQILWFFYLEQRFPLLKSSHIRSERCSKRSSPVSGVTRRALSDATFRFSIFASVFHIKSQILGFFCRKQRFSLLKPSHICSERCSKRHSSVPGVIRRALSDSMFGFSIFQSVFQENSKYWGLSTENRNFLY